MPQEKAATERQLALLKKLSGFITEHGYPPNRRELAELLGVTSTNTVQGFIRKLVELGFLRVGGGARALVITEAGKAALQ